MGALKTYISVNPKGIDDTPFATEGAELIQNLRYDSQGDCWSNDRHLVSYANPDSDPSIEANAYPLSDILSINSWQQYLLYEYLFSDIHCTLALRIGNTTVDLAYNRSVPSATDLGTQYVQFSNYMVLINGDDYPLIYQGDRRIRRVGNIKPPTPPVLSVPAQAISDYNEESVGLFVRAGSVSSNAKLLQFPAASGYGLGLGARPYNYYDQTDKDQKAFSELVTNTYEYAVSFVTDTGSESPISARSTRASWTGGGIGQEDDATPPNNKLVTATYGINLRNIPTGPVGTVKRILYRTKNMQDLSAGGAGEELYFLTTIDDNITQNWLDAIPDSGLGSLAPLSFERIPFPKCSIGAAFQNRLVVAGNPSAVYTLYYSDPGLPEQFSSSGIVNVSSARGGRITGLVPFNNLLIIFRESAVDALLNTGNGLQVVPVNASIGSLSPNTAVSIAGLGLMFLGADRKFYLLTGNYSGGSSIQITEASKTIGKQLRRINPSSLARAFAIYNPRDREYWCHVPSLSSPICDLGFVYHLDTQGWSIRSFDPALSSATLLPEGYVAFGTLNSTQGWLRDPGSEPVRLGIQVWGGIGNYADAARYPFIYESKWLHFGQPDSIKTIKDIEVLAYKNAYVDITDPDLPYLGNIEIFCAVDNREYFRSMGEVPLTNQEQSRTGILDLIITDNGVINDYAIWDQNYYDNGDQTITVRVNNNSSTNVGYPEELDLAGRMMSAIDSMSNPTGGSRWYKVRVASAGDNREVRMLGVIVTYEANDIKPYTALTGVGIGG